jgi:TldD protein
MGKKQKICGLMLFLSLIFSICTPEVRAALDTQRIDRGDMAVLNAMKDELVRSRKKLKLKGYEYPYFISYQIKDNDYYSIEGKYGAIVSSDRTRMRRLFVDVRVGDYRFDNSIKGFQHSNGHGRASYGQTPMARMSNTIIESSREYPKDKLKELLIEEVKRQNKPFGLIIKTMQGGETNTSSFNFQAFRGTPLVLYKVDPKTGKETSVRDIEIVGTPIVTVNKIIATGDDYAVFNGFCGAESGYVPVSTVAPSILVSEMEFQREFSRKEKLPLLPPPVFDTEN